MSIMRPLHVHYMSIVCPLHAQCMSITGPLYIQYMPIYERRCLCDDTGMAIRNFHVLLNTAWRKPGARETKIRRKLHASWLRKLFCS